MLYWSALIIASIIFSALFAVVVVVGRFFMNNDSPDDSPREIADGDPWLARVARGALNSPAPDFIPFHSTEN